MEKEVSTSEEERATEIVIYFVDPTAHDICILCHCDIKEKFPNDKDHSYKLNLWKGKNKDVKSQSCLDLENFFGSPMKKNRDFQCICKYCHAKVKRQLDTKKELEDMLEKGRLCVERKFLKTRTKRSISKESFTHKKACNNYIRNQTSLIESIKIQLMHADQKEEVMSLPIYDLPFIKALKVKDYAAVLEFLYRREKDGFLSFVHTTVSSEADELCKRDANSTFSLRDVNDAEKLSYENQYLELRHNSPLFCEVLSAVAFHVKANSRNKIKKTDSLVPSLVNAAGNLLFARNRKMNSIPTFNSLVLRRGRANKECINRFNALNICLSPTSVLQKQLALGNDYLSPIKKLAADLEFSAAAMLESINNSLQKTEAEMEIELSTSTFESSMNLTAFTAKDNDSFFDASAMNPSIEMINISYSNFSDGSSDDDVSERPHEDDLKAFPNWKPFSKKLQSITNDKEIDMAVTSHYLMSFSPKFTIVGDNVDIRTKRRRYLMNRSAIDRHYFNMMVVNNRIPIPENLIGVKARRVNDVYDILLSIFLPTSSDEELTCKEMKILVSRDLVRYIDSLKWMKKYVIHHIDHKYQNETMKKSIVYPCGVVDQNENTEEGIIEIMKTQHQLVPGHGSDNLVRIFSVGDLLTVEREQNAQEDVRDSPDRSTRLEGLIPALADFHTYGNFLEVIWHILYETHSSMDIGTLYQARNFLNSKAVPASPMKDVNACEELLLKYSEALLLAAFNDFESSHEVPIDSKNDTENKAKMEIFLDEFFGEYMMCEVPDCSTTSFYECPYCKSSYKEIVRLRKHILERHQSMNENHSNQTSDDAVRNYSQNALYLGYLIKNFLDARRHGDGERLIRLYKFLLIYFKIDRRTKYSFQSLHLLAQINYLLPPALAHELTWNRSVNTTGRIDGNVELDRHLEHLNKYVKADLAQYQGKITEKSIARCSRSYYKMAKILQHIDSMLPVTPPSGRHSSVSWDEDVKELSRQYSEEKLFSQVNGRFHSRFPGFPRSYPSKLNVLEFKTWAYKKIKQFSRMNIYQVDDLVTQ